MGVGDMASWGETGRGRGQERQCCRGDTPQMADIREGRLGLYPLPRTVTGYLVRGCAENASKKSWAGATWALRMAVGSHVWHGETCRDHLPFMATAPQGSQATLLTVSLVFDLRPLRPRPLLHSLASAKMRVASLLACIALPLLAAAQSVCTSYGLP